MIEAIGNLWIHYAGGHWICITTNGYVKKNGEAVMGRGCAKEAATRFPELPKELGLLMSIGGNKVYKFSTQRILSFPVKHHWSEPAHVELIKRSFRELLRLVNSSYKALGDKPVFLPRPGCGNGRLDWETQVKPALLEVFEEDEFCQGSVEARVVLISNERD